MTSKEKFIKSIHLKTPLDLESSNRSVILDTNEIAADVGSHHMSACYLKAKVSITTERKPRPGPYNGEHTLSRWSLIVYFHHLFISQSQG